MRSLRVDAGDAGDLAVRQPVFEFAGGPVVARDVRQFAHDEAAHEHVARFKVALVDAVVPDQRVGHRDDLPGIGRVGEHLLVAGE